MASEERWSLKGDYFENCNCEILCPCIVGGGPAVPTEGHCDVAFAFHIDEGEYQGVALDDLNFVVVAYTPGIMGDGDWILANYIDERADQFQRAALTRILSGEVGGPSERWMRLTSDYRGIQYCQIDFRSEGHSRSVKSPRHHRFHRRGPGGGPQHGSHAPGKYRPPGKLIPGHRQRGQQRLRRSRNDLGQLGQKRPLLHLQLELAILSGYHRSYPAWR